MGNSPKRHHHLTQAIQRNFLEKGKEKLWWYSRQTNAYEARSPKACTGRWTLTVTQTLENDKQMLVVFTWLGLVDMFQEELFTGERSLDKADASLLLLIF